MNLTPNFKDYELIDSGEGEKLERFGRYTLRRPEPQAVWRKSLDEREWQRLADASFLRTDRSEERGEWRNKPQMRDRWNIRYDYKEMHLTMRLPALHSSISAYSPSRLQIGTLSTTPVVQKSRARGQNQRF